MRLIFRTFKKGKPNFLDYSKFIDNKNLDIDTKRMLQVIENKSSKHNIFNKNPDLKTKLTQICENNYELTDFCNGHDMLNILAISFKKTISNKNIAGTDIESNFNMAYRYDDFKKTELYNSLKNWDTKNLEFNLFIDTK